MFRSKIKFTKEYGVIYNAAKDTLPPPYDMYDVITIDQEKRANERRKKDDKYLDNCQRCYEEYLKQNQEYKEIENPNLFIPLSKESHREIFKCPDNYTPEKKQKMCEEKADGLIKSYSSMVLQLNMFEYWRQKREGYKHIADILGMNPEGIINMHYEGVDDKNDYKFKIYRKIAGNHPQPDIFFEYETGSIIAIECKFSEPYRKIAIGEKKTNWSGFDKYYISGERNQEDTKNWCGLNNFKEFIVNQCKNDTISEFKYIDVKQIATHILGLNKIIDKKTISNREKSKYCLIYLYFPAYKINEKNELICDEIYDNEIKKIQSILSLDGVQFYSKTWIDIFNGFVKKYKENILDNEDKKYLKYNLERYFPRSQI